jgi:hypothetical protein
MGLNILSKNERHAKVVTSHHAQSVHFTTHHHHRIIRKLHQNPHPHYPCIAGNHCTTLAHFLHTPQPTSATINVQAVNGASPARTSSTGSRAVATLTKLPPPSANTATPPTNNAPPRKPPRPSRVPDQRLGTGIAAFSSSLYDFCHRRSRLHVPDPCAAIYRKRKQYTTASSPPFCSGQKPRGACAIK